VLLTLFLVYSVLSNVKAALSREKALLTKGVSFLPTQRTIFASFFRRRVSAKAAPNRADWLW
jgi:hypothetical protein